MIRKQLSIELEMNLNLQHHKQGILSTAEFEEMITKVGIKEAKLMLKYLQTETAQVIYKIEELWRQNRTAVTKD